MTLKELFKSNRVVAVCGNRNQAKSSLILSEVLNIKATTSIPIYIFGVEDSLKPYLQEKSINILYNIEDILDLKISGSLIIIDEFADVFPNIKAEGKQQQSIKRFFNRLNHLNNWVVISTAQDKFYNSFLCGLIDVFLVKQIDFDSLVNGTYLKKQVEGVANDDYRLYCDKNKYYIISKDKPTQMATFEYIKELDSKKEQVNFFN